MAYSISAPITAFNAGATVSQGSVTYASGDSVFVTAVLDNKGTTTAISVTDGTNTYTLVGYLADTSAIGLYYCKSAVAGTYTVQAAANGTSPNGTAMAIVKVSGLDQTATPTVLTPSFDRPSVATTDGTTTGSASPPSQPALVYGFCYNQANSTAFTAGTGFTDQGTLTAFAANVDFAISEHKRVTSTASVAATFTFPTTALASLSIGAIVPEAGAGGGGGTGNPLRVTLGMF